MRADALIFDLDGTLWDTNATCAVAWNRVLVELGVERPPVADADADAVLDRFTQLPALVDPLDGAPR